MEKISTIFRKNWENFDKLSIDEFIISVEIIPRSLKDIVKLKQFHTKPNEIPNELITPSNTVKPRSSLEVGFDFIGSKFKTKGLRTQDQPKNQIWNPPKTWNWTTVQETIKSTETPQCLNGFTGNLIISKLLIFFLKLVIKNAEILKFQVA